MEAPLLQKTDLNSRKQRVHLVILCSLGILAICLGVLLVLPSLSPRVPRWYRAHYAAGRVPPTAKFATRQGLHLARKTLGRSVQDDIMWFRVGASAWWVEVMSPID